MFTDFELRNLKEIDIILRMGLLNKGFIITFLCLLSFASVGQEVIVNFKAEHYKGNVLLTWSITQGNTCNGVDVLRSSDSVNFVQIGSIEGICGSTQESIAYSFTDNFPVPNKRNYYRLSLGGIGFSKIIGIDIIVIGENNYLLRPNPVTTESELFFENNSVTLCTMRVLNASGSTVVIEGTTGDKFVLNRSNFKNGVYFFSLEFENGNSGIFGQFVVE